MTLKVNVGEEGEWDTPLEALKEVEGKEGDTCLETDGNGTLTVGLDGDRETLR